VYKQNAEIGYWLAEPFWGKGIVCEALKQMVAYAFNTFYISRLYATPFGRNISSSRVLEKAGFTLEAILPNAVYKNGQFEDEAIYSLWRDKFEYKKF